MKSRQRWTLVDWFMLTLCIVATIYFVGRAIVDLG